MKKLGLYTALYLLTYTICGFGDHKSVPVVPDTFKSGIFFGLGGSYNSVKWDQYLSASDVSNVYNGSTLVAFGSAGGLANPYHDTETTFAPEAQLGALGRISNGEWIWGGKFLYRYLKLSFANNNIDSPQKVVFTTTSSAPANTSFIGNVSVKSAQANVNHELAFLLFFGRSFASSRVYLGVGPVVFLTHSKLYQARGFADANGAHVDVTGGANNFFSSQWVWGGIGQIGWMHYLNPSWFLDLGYTYAITTRFTNSYSAAFSSTAQGYRSSGTLYVDIAQRFTAQAFTLSINKTF